jgi:hypothetical protein
MLKKSLLAMAVASAGIANVNAQSIDGAASTAVPGAPAIVISAEGLAIQPTITIGAATGPSQITLTLNTTGTLNDTDLTTMSFTGATIASSSSPAFDDPNIQVIDVDPDSITFRANNGQSIAPGALVLSGVTLENITGTIAASSITVIPGTDITLNEVSSTPIAVIQSQFTLGNATGAMNRQFDAIIDVEAMRQQFTADSATPGGIPADSNRVAESVIVDNFFVSVDGDNADLLRADITGTEVQLTGGDLGFLAGTTNGADPARFDIIFEDDTVITAEAFSFNSMTNTLTTSSTGVPGAYVGIALLPEGNVDGAAQLNAQDFEADLTVNYDLGGTTASISNSNLDAGTWGLNGAAINIPFLPYGANFAQVIRISNDSNASAAIELMAFDNSGNTFGPVVLTTSAAAQSVTNVVPAINAALADEGFSGTGELDITLIINASAGDIDGVANYRVLSANDRVSVPVLSQND